MDIVLIPGFWLTASSWSEVVPPLEAAGHRVWPLTLPGLESRSSPRADIGLRDHVDAVVHTIDSLSGPVVLVGHSGGGAIAYAATDARPDRVARVVYVDSGPLASGTAINRELPVVDGEIPLPEWDAFSDADLVGLDDEIRATFRARAIPQPRGVAFDEQELRDERRYRVPATVIACEFDSRTITEWIASGHPHVAELGAVENVEYIDLPTGHWPQFSRPADLATAILAAVDRT